MKNKIFGGIGMVWGGLLVLNWILRGGPVGSSAYASGQFVGVILGALMAIIGAIYFFKRPD